MPNSTHTMVLFDIDGTLIQTARAGLRGMSAAFARLYGHDAALDGVAIAGRTDRAILSDVFRSHHMEPSDSLIHAVREAYVEALRVEITRPPTGPFGVLPGVWPVLDMLDRRGDVSVALLTGNFESGARVKLGHFDLWRRFAFGAFGDDHVDRRDLVPVALARAREIGVHVSPANVIVIGDTPLDVDCARAHGARAIAVATGQYTLVELSATGADLVVDTLEALDANGEWVHALAGG